MRNNNVLEKQKSVPKESAKMVGSGCFWGKENKEAIALFDSMHIYDSGF